MPASAATLERGAEAASLSALARAAAACERCPLYRNATQTVFGEGPADAAIMMVGEQPGDVEDREGRPFVGPAGKLLDRALAGAGIDRASVYLTNAVKHFKHEQRGKRRLHKRPNAYEIQRCRWWLDGELALLRPKLVVALGVTAASALAGRAVVISRERAKAVAFGYAAGLVTIHPSAILRIREDDARAAAMAEFVRDLRAAKKMATA